MGANWKIKSTIIEEDKIIHYKILEDDRYLLFDQVFSYLKSNEDFRSFYSNVLQANLFKAYFWEHPSLNKERLDHTYEFVLIKSKSLASVSPKPNSFQSYFTKEQVVSFLNLRGDALLIVPCPIATETEYTHLANFIRMAPTDQVHYFWEKVSMEFMNYLSEENTWLSTSGLGVHWLHVRFDSRPKYYQYKAYK